MKKILFWSAVMSVSLFLESVNTAAAAESAADSSTAQKAESQQEASWWDKIKSMFGFGSAATNDVKAPENAPAAPDAAKTPEASAPVTAEAAKAPEANTPATDEKTAASSKKDDGDKATEDAMKDAGEEVLKLDDAAEFGK
ncbi:hypothetical protein FACS189472_00250 [Alphaproteobacteria bacterium]|nr:hypothetical protein FACS189472_00250 [Alphaproteobacteria bacterium]